MADVDSRKVAAAEAAAKLVEDGMVVGLGIIHSSLDFRNSPSILRKYVRMPAHVRARGLGFIFGMASGFVADAARCSGVAAFHRRLQFCHTFSSQSGGAAMMILAWSSGVAIGA